MKRQNLKDKKHTEKSIEASIVINGILQYKQYAGSIEYDNEDNMFYGKVLYINDSVLFSGNNIEKLTAEFKNAIKDYLSMCKEEGLEPNKPMSGVFNIRTTPEYHYCLSVISKRENTSLNNVINEAIKKFLSLNWLIPDSTKK